MKSKSQKILRIGLGEAIARLIKLEQMRSNRLHPIPSEAIKEREMLYLALNEIKIDLGFDCNNDGIPDSFEIFEASAKSSCCRLIQTENISPIKEDIAAAKNQKGSVSKLNKTRSSRRKKR